MYKKVDKFPDMPVLENRMLEFWDKEQVFNKLRQQNKGGQKWSFLDGPITANNPMGVHHAWGRALKDIFQRYHAMQGCELRYQNGFDCQGLWVEVEVEKELGFETKKDILKFGLDKFVEACKERVRKYSAIQTRQSVRLGYWMDWDNSYYTMADENNYTIWGFLKKCHQREFVYKGADVMPWCPRCGVGLSQMEMHEGYKQVCHKAAFVRFKLKDKDNEYLLVWTTTPWTLTSNVSAAVGPELEYLKVKSKKDNAVYYVAEGCFDFQRLEEEHKSKDWPEGAAKLKTIKQIFEEQGGSEVIGRLKGKDMEGWMYEGPFDELPAQNNIGGYPKVDKQLSHKSLNGVNCHKVVLWKDVAEGEGTGIVHIAPGCGAEDFQLGQEIGLVAIAPLDEEGNYLDGFDWLTGRNAGDPELAKEICKNLEQKGVLFAAEQYPHSYPHCWRCNTELVYRFVDEWFINMSWREEIKKVAQKICWIPDWGKDRELEWLTNMRDWMISKKRFWGLALPIWECDQEDCSWFEVIGGYDELKERAVKGWDKFEGHSPHRPWIDEVKIKCAKCGSQASRIEDVGNPWLDAGIVPYSTVNYKTDPDYWKEWIPADLVLECFPGQFRNWFYALLAMSTMMENVPPFKTLLGHALVKDEQGRDMHKSLGNSIDFETASNKVGAEILRYIYASWNPANNLLFGWDMAKEYNRRIMTLWNTYSFYITYAQADNFNPSEFKLDVSKRTILDKWILSRTHRLVKNARVYYDNYELHRHIKEFEEYLEDLSNWYLRRSRRRFWGSDWTDDKQAAFLTLYECLDITIRLIAPVMPFITESMYDNITRSWDRESKISIHLQPLPVADESLIDEGLEDSMRTLIQSANLGRAARSQAQIKVRQPLNRILIYLENGQEARAGLENSRDIIQEELNIKEVSFIDNPDDLSRTELKLNVPRLGKVWKDKMKSIQKAFEAGNKEALTKDYLSSGRVKLDTPEIQAELSGDDLIAETLPAKGYAVVRDKGMLVAIETTITKELKLEGLARDFVRQVQNYRRELDLDVSDRIELIWAAEDAEVKEALNQFKDYIANEVLAAKYEEGQGEKEFKFAGKKVSVKIKPLKASRYFSAAPLV